MHALTVQIVAELDQLYGLYQLAVDLSRRIKPDDEATTARVIEARQKILERTAVSSKEAAGLLKAFKEERMLPANERALVEEKRSLILDIAAKMQAADNQVMRLMQAKLAAVRREMAGQTEKKNAIKAYITAPQATALIG
jgi:hypothetical protein